MDEKKSEEDNKERRARGEREVPFVRPPPTFYLFITVLSEDKQFEAHYEAVAVHLPKLYKAPGLALIHAWETDRDGDRLSTKELPVVAPMLRGPEDDKDEGMVSILSRRDFGLPLVLLTFGGFFLSLGCLLLACAVCPAWFAGKKKSGLPSGLRGALAQNAAAQAAATAATATTTTAAAASLASGAVPAAAVPAVAAAAKPPRSKKSD